MVGFYLCFSLLPLMGFTDQEVLRLLTLHQPSPSTLPHTSSPRPTAVPVTVADLPTVSSSVSAAESWVESHVLAGLPSTGAATIDVGAGVLCNRSLEHHWRLVPPSVKNLYYSLERRGLLEEIRVSVSLSSDCFGQPPHPSGLRDGLAREILEPLLRFLEDSNLRYSIDPPTDSPLIAEITDVAGFSGVRGAGLVREAKPMSRKLASLSSLGFP